MKLDFYKHVIKSIETDKSIKLAKFQLVYFRLHDEKWYKHDTKTLEVDKDLIKLLSTIHKSKQGKKVKNVQFINVDVINTVIRITFPKHTASSKSVEFINLLHEVIDYAESSYYASHDQLTRILNRTGSEKRVKDLFVKLHLNLTHQMHRILTHP